jgi:hypothetical protein
MKAKAMYLRASKDASAGANLFTELLEKHASHDISLEYRRSVQDVVRDIPHNASDETKYEIAYENWIHQGRMGYAYVRQYMGIHGIEAFKEERVRMLVAEDSRMSGQIYLMLKTILPATAFRLLVRRLTDEMQWITPSCIKEISSTDAIIEVPHCRVKTFEATEDFCKVGCQETFPDWMHRQYGVIMNFSIHPPGCTCYVSQA